VPSMWRRRPGDIARKDGGKDDVRMTSAVGQRTEARRRPGRRETGRASSEGGLLSFTRRVPVACWRLHPGTPG
jgi:hypothetical protein